jgi:hypothetical protein
MTRAHEPVTAQQVEEEEEVLDGEAMDGFRKRMMSYCLMTGALATEEKRMVEYCMDSTLSEEKRMVEYCMDSTASEEKRMMSYNLMTGAHATEEKRMVDESI